LRAGVAILLVIGCSSKTSDVAGPSSETDPVRRAAAMAEATPVGTPHWPSGMRWLGGDRTFTHAIEHGRDLVAVSGDEVLLVPKDGCAAVSVTRLSGFGVSPSTTISSR
jgi:hypothetical protein